MQLSVIIVSYNVKYYLEQCLHSVLTACVNINAEIIVIDNASADNSIDYLKPKFPEISFIQNEKNAGFAKANNKALKTAKGNYILYLNPDTILSENVISNCISFLDEKKKAGAAGVKMIDGNGNFLPESKRAFPSIMASFWKFSGIGFFFPTSAIFNKYALGNLDENKIYAIDVLSGAFFLSRREIILSLKGFDEDFFMYGEDIDLSYRIQKSGYENYYLGNNVIVHFKGESTQKNKAGYTKHFYGAMKIFVDKHYSNISSMLLKFAITAGASFSLISKKLRYILLLKKYNAAKYFLLMGDDKAIESAASVLSANNYLFRIADTHQSIDNYFLNKKQSRFNLVFCIDEMSVSSCIQFIKKNKKKFIYYWHYKDSTSIISSSNTIAVPQIYITI